MHFTAIASAAIAIILSTPALACKCYTNGHVVTADTRRCCGQLNGVFRGGNDCLASSISEHLSNFRACCGGHSDCDYPDILENEEEDYIKTIVATTTKTAAPP